MALTALEQIGRHKIQSLIGRGGLGEVYRALDTKLERDVGVKQILRVPGGHCSCGRRKHAINYEILGSRK